MSAENIANKIIALLQINDSEEDEIKEIAKLVSDYAEQSQRISVEAFKSSDVRVTYEGAVVAILTLTIHDMTIFRDAYKSPEIRHTLEIKPPEAKITQ